MSDQLSSTTQLFGHHTIKDIETIERVQRRFTKKLPGLRKFSYDAKLSRLRYTWCYKILFGIVEMSAAEEFFCIQHMLPNYRPPI